MNIADRQQLLSAIRNLAAQIDMVAKSAEKQVELDETEAIRLDSPMLDNPALQRVYMSIISDSVQRLQFLLNDIIQKDTITWRNDNN